MLHYAIKNFKILQMLHNHLKPFKSKIGFRQQKRGDVHKLRPLVGGGFSEKQIAERWGYIRVRA